MDKIKEAAAKYALSLVKPGMKIGLGSGSTAEIFIELLGEKNEKTELDLTCIATSFASEKQAQRLGLRLVGFGEIDKLDMAFDGADQVDSELNLIKGLGGALVREKIVDYRAEKLIILVGENKMVRTLSGTVPVEVIPLAEEAVKRDLLKLGATRFETRMDGRRKFVSDNSNLIIHADFKKIADPKRLEAEINGIAGVVDNGIFSQKTPTVIIGQKNGSTRVL